MRRIFLAAGAACAVAAPAAVAFAPPTGWDGVNPFACTLHQAGFEASDGATTDDPYCVEFDKRRQNVSELGVVDFLSKEPARVAAALDKCFYFQSDHWRAALVQDDGSTKTYEWDGHYFFDKARAEGGAWVTNFNVNGHTFDPSQIPGIPQEFARHMGPGTGGVRTRNEIPADPSCVAKAAAPGARIYATAPATGCTGRSGGIGPGVLGPVAVGDTEEQVRHVLGAPERVHRGFLRYCVAGGGELMVGQTDDRSGEQGFDPAAASTLLVTTHRGYRLGGVGPGVAQRLVRRAFPRARRRTRIGSTRVLELRSGVLAGVRRGRVRYLAVASAATLRDTRLLRGLLRRAGA